MSTDAPEASANTETANATTESAVAVVRRRGRPVKTEETPKAAPVKSASKTKGAAPKARTTSTRRKPIPAEAPKEDSLSEEAGGPAPAAAAPVEKKPTPRSRKPAAAEVKPSNDKLPEVVVVHKPAPRRARKPAATASPAEPTPKPTLVPRRSAPTLAGVASLALILAARAHAETAEPSKARKRARKQLKKLKLVMEYAAVPLEHVDLAKALSEFLGSVPDRASLKAIAKLAKRARKGQ